MDFSQFLFFKFCSIFLSLLTAINLGKILWYASRANASYCFLCASPSCSSESLHKHISSSGGKNSSSSGTSKIIIEWKVGLAKCVDSTPLVVGFERSSKEGNRVVCFVASHKGIVLAVEGMQSWYISFSFFLYVNALYLINTLLNVNFYARWRSTLVMRCRGKSGKLASSLQYWQVYVSFASYNTPLSEFPFGVPLQVTVFAIFRTFFSYPSFLSKQYFESDSYVGDYDGNLNCIAIATGEIVWKYRTENQVKSSPYPSLEFF